ncbi:SMI1/KNR4 family protein [Segniliparus rugosus]|uniref:Knr4/Smi1-like domain-containing protein n=1 Tax=Segniliparus rugosus (strain ATCC BAA-974 / DSM 45345 / CCUG 50838 / CIP 108380 / JCM 13579 / CDC 945) TaxID=679197 RepID=U1M1S7_SEGRC|nr:SMI1/KNR4 family protein [Segniliparus rugosus]ERG69327.1 hypothetical protein HMPREF9336_04218 [Segniliparus rugosus ATCC BAA-974]
MWRAPPAPAYAQPPLTDESLEAVGRQLGVRLPESLVELLRFQNGGLLQVEFSKERGHNVTHYVIRGVGPNDPRIEKQAWWHENPDFSPRPMQAEWLIPFDGGGHWDLCLDYRRSPTDPTGLRTCPATVVVDSECGPHESCESFVAASFDDYLDQLVPADDW